MTPVDYFGFGVAAGVVIMGAFAALIMRAALETQKQHYSKYVDYYRTHIWGRK